VDTIDPKGTASRRRRRVHSDEFKADAVAAATQPGMSLAAVALSRGVNANLLGRWVREAEAPRLKALLGAAAVSSTFVPVQLPQPVAPAVDIRLELRRGGTTITVAWPVAASAECASWMRELLR
jgi:transposase